MKPLLLSCLLLLILSATAQTPSWQWANGIAAPDGGYAKPSISTDAYGNVYMTGGFYDTITFGNDTLAAYIAGGQYYMNVFLVKYDSLGNILWAKSIGAGGTNAGTAIAADAKGNIYLAGSFTSPSFIIGNDTLINTNDSGSVGAIFIAKLDSSGRVAWAESAGSQGSDIAYNVANAISIDNNGNVYMTGIFDSATITFGAETLTNPADYDNAFIVKYDSTGNVVWAKSLGGIGDATGTGIGNDAAGNIYVTGDFHNGTLIFGTDTLVDAAGGDAFVAKFTPSGNAVWGKSIKGITTNGMSFLSTDTKGNSYVTGFFQDTTLTLDTIVLANLGKNSNIFTARYDSSGNVVWAKSVIGSGSNASLGVACDTNGNSYITGYFESSSILFGAILLVNNYDSTGISDIFVAKYDSAGNVIWAKSAGASGPVISQGISIGIHGDYYVTGNSSGNSLFFGGDTIAGSAFEMFVAKLNFDSCVYTLSQHTDTCPSSLAATYDSVCIVTTGSACYWHATVPSDTSWLSTTSSGTGPGVVNITVQVNLSDSSRTGTINVEGQILTITQPGIDTTGINVIRTNAISVYPNPSTGQFYFKRINSGSTLEVYDVLGQNVYSTIVAGDTYLLNISTQSKGVYFYRVTDSNVTVQQGKIVIE